jgi:hypothetical protein
VTVFEAKFGSDCDGPLFLAGGDYLVFARHIGDDPLWADLPIGRALTAQIACGFTHDVSSASKTLQLLGLARRTW